MAQAHVTRNGSRERAAAAAAVDAPAAASIANSSRAGSVPATASGTFCIAGGLSEGALTSQSMAMRFATSSRGVVLRAVHLGLRLAVRADVHVHFGAMDVVKRFYHRAGDDAVPAYLAHDVDELALEVGVSPVAEHRGSEEVNDGAGCLL